MVIGTITLFVVLFMIYNTKDMFSVLTYFTDLLKKGNRAKLINRVLLVITV